MAKNSIHFTPYMVKFNQPSEQEQVTRLMEFIPRPYERQYDLSKQPEVEEEQPVTKTPEQVSIESVTVKKPESPMMTNWIIADDYKPIKGENVENIKTIATRLSKEGFTKGQTAAILATIIKESKADPFALGDKGRAHGILQWHKPRWANQSTLNSQLDLLVNEIRDYNNENAWGKSNLYTKRQAFDIFAGDDLYKSIQALTHNYVRPSDSIAETEERYEIAKAIYDQLI